MAPLPMLLTLLTAALSLLPSSHAIALEKRAALTQVTDFAASNPSNTLMYIYVPTALTPNPAIIVAIHYCTGTAQAYYSGSPYASLADKYGFIVIYPQSPYSGTCWDVSSKAALTHNGAGSDSKAIADMVTYTLQKYSGNASKVFVTGSSSGAMMTNVMAATYPELFAAATAYSGVPAGCFMSASNQVQAWNSSCAQGTSIWTPQQWANVVTAMDPGYTGPRPRFQVYHGSVDTTLLPQNYNETVKQWTAVFGFPSYTTPDKRTPNFPAAGYTTDTWGISAADPLGKVQGVYAVGVGHTVPINGTQDMMWFQLGPYATSSSPPPATSSVTVTLPPGAASSTAKFSTTGTSTSKSVVTTTASTVAATPTGPTAAHWAQCGGIGFTGPTVCAAPWTCKVNNAYFSQCL